MPSHFRARIIRVPVDGYLREGSRRISLIPNLTGYVVAVYLVQLNHSSSRDPGGIDDVGRPLSA